MPKPETLLIARMRRELERRGAYVIKIHGDRFQTREVDLIVCYRGRFIALEVKIPGEQATPLQLHTLRQIDKAGGAAAVVHSTEAIMRLLDALDCGAWDE